MALNVPPCTIAIQPDGSRRQDLLADGGGRHCRSRSWRLLKRSARGCSPMACAGGAVVMTVVPFMVIE